MALSASPAIRQSYINAILGNIHVRFKYSAVMGILLLHSLKLTGPFEYLKDILKVMLKNELKIFRTL